MADTCPSPPPPPPLAHHQVDVADFSGPDFKDVDNRFAALTLVQKDLCDAALFSPSGVQPTQPLDKHAVASYHAPLNV